VPQVSSFAFDEANNVAIGENRSQPPRYGVVLVLPQSLPPFAPVMAKVPAFAALSA
jgi:hypothetical protein